MNKKPTIAIAISAVLATGLLLGMSSTSRTALASVNCNPSGTICSGGGGAGGGGSGGGGGSHTIAECGSKSCPSTVSGGSGGGGIESKTTGGSGGQTICSDIHTCTTIHGGGKP
jgi:hypothetical protein